ncbi:MAG: leucine-rich repeat domain-containing protein [Ruminococcus sp.]|nr:leucine-rich repeat domain-containing protein [Ruminococcus sp.]
MHKFKNNKITGRRKKIGAYAFYACTDLKNVKIPKSLSDIGLLSFSGTNWLKNKQAENPLVIVNGILIDGMYCKGNVTIPKSVKTIGAGAFYRCSNLKSVKIPKSVNSICGGAFFDCIGLETIIIPNSIKSIGKTAFSNCTSLKKVKIPKGVKTICNEAFANCQSLKR